MIYNELKADHSKTRNTRFYRLAPRGEKLQEFGMDETDVGAMTQVQINMSKWLSKLSFHSVTFFSTNPSFLGRIDIDAHQVLYFTL